jgi:hypothetical protein
MALIMNESTGSASTGRERVKVQRMDKAPIPSWLTSAALWGSRRRGDAGIDKLALGEVPLHFAEGATQFAEAELQGVGQLRPVDLRLLLVVCQRVAMQSEREYVRPSDGEDYTQALRRLGWPEQVLRGCVVAWLELPVRGLLASLGLTDTGSNRANLKASLRRLESMDFSCVVDGSRFRWRMLDVFEESKTSIHVLLNPQLTYPGVFKRGVAWVDLEEQRSLKSEPARQLHAWLSGWCSGGKRHIRFGNLLSHVWPDEPKSPDALRYRRKCLSDALDAIAGLPGWLVSEDSYGVVSITMPSRPSKGNRSPGSKTRRRKGGAA